MHRHPITPEGYARLLADLTEHRHVLRPKVVQDIEEARAHGDISENAEFEDAKERQALLEGRIAWLETQLAGADIIDVTKLQAKGQVVFGSTVLLENADTGEERTLRIVGEPEADASNGTISLGSPFAQAILGRSEGDEANVPTPSGKQLWEIVEVRYV
ncbi:MAG: transcription elongation factor GreA [Deltaproteobacteria bacterium]|nr:transcription elongation factor GreA [Deltaproteobacteria bacterium]MBW2255302.1 transcription elongation factor GreA [Deltaproteobacteria bacterium]